MYINHPPVSCNKYIISVCTCMCTTDEPQGTIIFNQFLLPLPRVSTRDVVAMKLWIPEYLNDDGSSGEPAAMGSNTITVFMLIECKLKK